MRNDLFMAAQKKRQFEFAVQMCFKVMLPMITLTGAMHSEQIRPMKLAAFGPLNVASPVTSRWSNEPPSAK